MRKLRITLLLTCLLNLSQAVAESKSVVDPQHIKEIIEAWNSQQYFSGTVLKDYRNIPDITEVMVPLTLVIYETSGWTDDEVKLKVKNTRRIFLDQCQIKFNPLTLLRTSNNHGVIVDEATPGPYIAENKLEEAAILENPVFYFVKSENMKIPNKAAWSYMVPEGSVSETKKRARNSGFIYRSNALYAELNSDKIESKSLGEYEVLAHEIGHLLLLEDHSKIPGNFMSEDKERTNVISPTQCNIMKKNIQALKQRVDAQRQAHQQRVANTKTDHKQK